MVTALDAHLLGGEVALGQLWCSLFTLTFAAESKWKCFVLILYNGPFHGFFLKFGEGQLGNIHRYCQKEFLNRFHLLFR